MKINGVRIVVATAYFCHKWFHQGPPTWSTLFVAVAVSNFGTRDRLTR